MRSPDLLCGKADIGAVKAGCLKYHGLYIICDLGILTAHDTGNAHLLFAVTDHQHTLIQLSAPDRPASETVAVLCARRTMISWPASCVVIIGMHGLSVFFHHIVGDIHQVVDGTDAAGCQTSLHPLR